MMYYGHGIFKNCLFYLPTRVNIAYDGLPSLVMIMTNMMLKLEGLKIKKIANFYAIFDKLDK